MLVELLAKEGDTVAVKSIIAIIDDAAAVGSVSAAAAPKASPPAAPSAPEDAKRPDAAQAVSNGKQEPARSTPVATAPRVAAPLPPTINRADGVEAGLGQQPAPNMRARVTRADGAELEVTERFYSPLVKSIAQQYGLSIDELGGIAGSGAQGRVTKSDVLSYLETRGSSGGSAAPAPASTKPLPASAGAAAPAVTRPLFDDSGVLVQPMDNMRKLIADHMVRSKATSPHVYSVAEVDVTNIAKWREKVQPAFLKREGFKLSFTPFFLEAVAKGLLQFPGINASVEGTNLILKKNINLGCAVALGNTGLIVPVIKNADMLNLTGIAHSLNDLAERARNKKLVPDEIQGGTFTVTNVGTFGNIIGYPIINQPQLAILAVGAIKKRVMVVGDAIAIRDMVYLTLSYDHRVIDGSLSGQFLQFVTKYLEGWDLKREL